MSLALSDFNRYSDIVIQCHDNPDADALASGHALQWYLEKNGIYARFVYSGKNKIQKSNLLLMVDRLGINTEYVTELERKPELLVAVDCQYGQSNMTRFDASNVAVIDHHQVSGKLPELSDVRSNYGSCATVMYKLLNNENIDINEDQNLATALYYGLMTDTNGFSEIHHPCDKDLRDFANFSNTEITLFKNSNLSMDELKIAGDALKGAIYNTDYSYGLIEAEPCDPNILGIISDMLLEVDCISSCLVYSILPFGIKLSIRSCIKEVNASELASFIVAGFGGGGGHLVKAGGFMQRELIEAAGVGYNKVELNRLIDQRMREYFISSEILYAGEHKEDLSTMSHYMKKDIIIGYVKVTDIGPVGRKVFIRTLEGDLNIVIEEDVFIIIGVDGEIYPIKRNKFEASYKEDDSKYVFPGEYVPYVIDTESGQRIELLPYAKSCIGKGGIGIYARKLDHRVKVFTAWDRDKYYLGNVGDYLTARADDPSDIYIITDKIFKMSYEEA